jgi:hypothetical protein
MQLEDKGVATPNVSQLREMTQLLQTVDRKASDPIVVGRPSVRASIRIGRTK